MRQLYAALAGLALVVLALAAGPAATENGPLCVLNTQLRAENEVPHVSTSEALGHTQIKIWSDGTIAWKTHINNKANESFTAGHIHLAPAGSAGGVVVPLFANAGVTDRQIQDRGTTVDADGPAICADPPAYYVNYHTEDIPAGAIRGQLG